MYIGAFSGWSCHILPVFLGHFHCKAHLVQWPFIFSSHGLHDSSEERLGIEEPCQPHRHRQHKVRCPDF